VPALDATLSVFWQLWFPDSSDDRLLAGVIDNGSAAEHFTGGEAEVPQGAARNRIVCRPENSIVSLTCLFVCEAGAVMVG
jgi:hypothetical protein